MSTRYYSIIGVSSLIAGLILFAIHHEWILICTPFWAHHAQQDVQHKKNITLSFWHDGRWHTEKQDILWSSAISKNTQAVTTSWLNTIEAEEVTDKKVHVETVILSPSGVDAYISFERMPFEKQWSIFKKWMWIEGLLKTIREHIPSLQHVYFLVRHKPLLDKHIDLSNPWPIHGFLSANEKQLQ